MNPSNRPYRRGLTSPLDASRNLRVVPSWTTDVPQCKPYIRSSYFPEVPSGRSNPRLHSSLILNPSWFLAISWELADICSETLAKRLSYLSTFGDDKVFKFWVHTRVYPGKDSPFPSQLLRVVEFIYSRTGLSYLHPGVEWIVKDVNRWVGGPDPTHLHLWQKDDWQRIPPPRRCHIRSGSWRHGGTWNQ